MADAKKEKKEKEKKAGAMSPRELPVAAAATQDDKLPEIRINGLQCKLHFVTVYNDQAELTRHVQATVKPGVQDIIVYGLTKDMDTNSVRVGGGRGKATILEVSTTKRFRQEEDKPVDPTAEERAKKIKEIDSEIQRIREAIARNGCEREWLKAHAAHVSSGSANEKVSSVPSIDDAAKYMRFYAENLERLDAKAVGYSKEIEAHEIAIKKLRISPVMPAPVVDREQLEITISIQAEEAGDVLFELSYMLKNASWEAAYETRVSSSNQKMAISYFGLITNRTGEAWDDVQLALSTAKPSTGGVPPEVHTIKVQQKRAPPMLSARMSSMSNSLAPPPRAQTFASNPLFSNDLADDALPSPSGGGGRPMAVLTSVVEAKATSVSFAIQRRAKVPADGSQRKVVIDVFTLDAAFLYTVVPQLSQNAFLRGTCLNTRNYPFLDGKLSVFMDGNFVATSKMKHTNAGEEFFCHLGTDAAVQVDFKPPKQYQESRMTGLMSRSFVDHTEHLTHIKNTKDFDVRVLMFEQCPRSENEKIKVKVVAPELKENDKSVVLNEFNNVRWELKIAAGGVVKVPYHFTVEYPNDIDVEYRNG